MTRRKQRKRRLHRKLVRAGLVALFVFAMASVVHWEVLFKLADAFLTAFLDMLLAE